jgi:hypothetical protein
MALFKTDEEKAAERAERDRANAAYAQQHAAAQAAFLRQKADAERAANPLGQAELALQSGLGFLEIQLEVSRITGQAGFGEKSATEQRSTEHLRILEQVEAMGWRLEHVGYVFVMTGEVSTDKVLVSGQHTAVNGKTMGIYLFRRTVPVVASAG